MNSSFHGNWDQLDAVSEIVNLCNAKVDTLDEFVNFKLETTALNFFRIENDASFRKRILKCLNEIHPELRAMLVSKISSEFKAMLCTSEDFSVNLTTVWMSQISKTVDVIKSFIESSTLGLSIIQRHIVEILKFYSNTLIGIKALFGTGLNKTDEMNVLDTLHIFLQSLITIFEKSNTYDNLDYKQLRVLYYSLRRLLGYKQIPLNTANNCGLLVVMLDYNFFELTSSIRLLKILRKNQTLEYFCLCYGFLACLPTEFLSCELLDMSDNRTCILLIIFHSVYPVSHKYPGNLTILNCNLKIVLLLTQHISLCKFDICKQTVNSIVSFLWSHLDHSVNVIRQMAKDSLHNLISQKDNDVVMKALNLVQQSKELDRRTCITILLLNSSVNANRILSCRKDLIRELLSAGKSNISNSYVSQVFISVMSSNYYEDELEQWFENWIEPLLSPKYVANIFIESALTAAVQLSPLVVTRLVNLCQVASEENYLSVIKCILVFTKFSCLVAESNFIFNNATGKLWGNCLPVLLIKKMLCSPNLDMANATVSLLLEDCRRNRKLSDDCFRLFQIYFNSNLCHSDPSYRQSFISMMDKILCQLREIQNVKTDLRNLIDWLSCQCFVNLAPGASYSRKFTVLQILEILNDTNIWSINKCSLEEKRIIFWCLADSFDDNQRIARNLLQSISTVKDFLNEQELIILYRIIVDMVSGAKFCEHNTVAYLLEVLLHCVQKNEECSDILFNCVINVCIKEDYTINTLTESLRGKQLLFIHVSVLLHLLRKQTSSITGQGFSSEIPLYGFLFVIKRLVESVESCYLFHSKNNLSKYHWLELIEQIVEICIQCNLSAVSVVSQASPEGYLSEDFEDIADDDTVCYSVSQRLLLFSWRTVKEASLLLTMLVVKFAPVKVEINEKSTSLIKNSVMIVIGDHLKSLITKIRHRGAFEQVYIALHQFCNCSWRCFQEPNVSSLPHKWLSKIAEQIETNSGRDKFCASRRSAGIPCIVQAVLSTEFDSKERKQRKSETLDTFINCMFRICRRGSGALKMPPKVDGKTASDSKIHAMNILRALFKNKDLAEQISIYVEEAFIIAITGVQSYFWNERNVSWLLFASLITKIFGVARSRHEISPKNKMTIKIFFRKFPSLYQFFVSRLQDIDNWQKDDPRSRSSVYAVLLVFARLDINQSGNLSNVTEFSFLPFLYKCSQSSVWKIRELAVSAVLPFINDNMLVDHMNTIWENITLPMPENSIHGYLLQFEVLVRHVLSKRRRNNDENIASLSQKVILDSMRIINSSSEHSYLVERQLLIIVSLLLPMVPCSTVMFSKSDLSLNGLLKYFHLPFLNTNGASKTPAEIFNNLFSKEDFFAFLIIILNWIADAFYATPILCTVAAVLEAILNYLFIYQYYLSETVFDVHREFFKVGLESVLYLFSEEQDFLPTNVILRNMPKKTKVLKEAVLLSGSVYNLTTKLFCLNEMGFILNILEHFIQMNTTIVVKNEILRYLIWASIKCRANDENVVFALVHCVDLFDRKFSTTSTKIEKVWELELHARLIEKISESRITCTKQKYIELVQFCYKHISSMRWWKDDYLILVGLKAWTFIMENAELLYEFFMEPVVVDFFPENHTKKCMVLQRLLETFFRQIPCDFHILCAAAFFSWTFRGVGLLLDDTDAKNVVFVSNIPRFLEDDFILSELSSKFLRQLSEIHAILEQRLENRPLFSWVLSECALNAEDLSAPTLTAIIKFISRKHGEYGNTFSHLSLRADSWKRRLISSKLLRNSKSQQRSFFKK